MSNVEIAQKGYKLNSLTVSNYTEKMILKVLFEHKGKQCLPMMFILNRFHLFPLLC